jgi:CSLREA domain-containing protein
MHTTGSRTRNGTRPLMLLVGIVAAIAFGLFAMHVNSARAGVAVKFTVNRSGDEVDATPGDGVCDIETGPPIHCTLRAAIEEANALNGPNVINFTATNTLLTSALPPITERVTIDASANPDGFSIDEAGFCGALDLATGSSGSIIRGLNIFGGCPGILIDGGANQQIGGDPSLGVAPAGQGNIIHGNCGDGDDDGIKITDGSLGGHIIEGNRIGTTPLGTTADGNCDDGIEIDGGIGRAITIGGDPAGTPAHFPNIISANEDEGIDFEGGTAPVLIQNNWIGLDIHGNASDPFANLDDGIEVATDTTTNPLAVATIKNNHIAGGGIDPGSNPGETGIDITSDGHTVLGNCIGFNSTCTGSAGGFNTNGIYIESDSNTVGDGTAAGRNVIGNIFDEGVLLDEPSSDNVVNGNYVGFGADGEENATVTDSCIEVELGDRNQITNNLVGNCGFNGGFPGIDVEGDTNLIQGNDIGRGTTPASPDDIDGFCIQLDGDDNNVLTNVMANCGADSPDASIKLGAELTSSGNHIQGNDITSPVTADAIEIEGGGIGNLVASRIFRMVNPTTGDLPIDLVGVEGVDVNDAGDADACGAGPNCLHNYPVFAPTSSTAGHARGSAGPYDHIRIYSKSSAGGVTTYEFQAEGDANLAGDFDISLGNLAQMTVVGTSTTTAGSTTDVACFITNCTSEFSVTEQVVAAGATPTSTATNTPTITMTPTITNTPPPTNTPLPTNTPVPPTHTPPPAATPTPSKFCGDVNDNGSVDSVDALLVLQLSAGLISTVPNAPSADVNHSGGAPNAIDAQLILQEGAGLIQISDLHCS